MKQGIFIFILIAGSFFSCLKRDEYPDEPVIVLESFTITADSAVLLLSFTDGDGNFGLDDTTFADPEDCPKNYNIFSEYYEKVNGQWQWVELNPCTNPNATPFYSRAPFAEPSGQFKAQKGEVKIVMDDYYLVSNNDTCRFEIYIVDVTQNRSNVVTTQEFVKPQ